MTSSKNNSASNPGARGSERKTLTNQDGERGQTASGTITPKTMTQTTRIMRRNTTTKRSMQRPRERRVKVAWSKEWQLQALAHEHFVATRLFLKSLSSSQLSDRGGTKPRM